jgi:hypothetical protein
MRIHDVVADLELDVLDLDDCREVLLRVYFLDRFGNDVPPWFLCRGAPGLRGLLGLQVPIHEVDLL